MILPLEHLNNTNCCGHKSNGKMLRNHAPYHNSTHINLVSKLRRYVGGPCKMKHSGSNTQQGELSILFFWNNIWQMSSYVFLFLLNPQLGSNYLGLTINRAWVFEQSRKMHFQQKITKTWFQPPCFAQIFWALIKIKGSIILAISLQGFLGSTSSGQKEHFKFVYINDLYSLPLVQLKNKFVCNNNNTNLWGHKSNRKMVRNHFPNQYSTSINLVSKMRGWGDPTNVT